MKKTIRGPQQINGFILIIISAFCISFLTTPSYSSQKIPKDMQALMNKYPDSHLRIKWNKKTNTPTKITGRIDSNSRGKRRSVPQSIENVAEVFIKGNKRFLKIDHSNLKRMHYCMHQDHLHYYHHTLRFLQHYHSRKLAVSVSSRPHLPIPLE